MAGSVSSTASGGKSVDRHWAREQAAESCTAERVHAWAGNSTPPRRPSIRGIRDYTIPRQPGGDDVLPPCGYCCNRRTIDW
jgi:hypothetical protein